MNKKTLAKIWAIIVPVIVIQTLFAVGAVLEKLRQLEIAGQIPTSVWLLVVFVLNALAVWLIHHIPSKAKDHEQ